MTSNHANSSWDAWICGVLIVVIAFLAHYSDFPATISWMNIAIGVWLFISPWVVNFASATSVMAWSVWIIGAIVFILALWAEIAYRYPSAKATV
jgi:hypothetical protein